MHNENVQDCDVKIHFSARDHLDITNKNTIKKFCLQNNITHIVNVAAYTAVDKAEEDSKNADRVNHLAVQYLALVAKEHNISLIHISTDYVFDGKNYRPYVEEDATNPQSVYGRTKLAGEEALRAINPKNSIIIRTSWVYSAYGNNFVKTMLRLGKARNKIKVVYDQVGAPTYARDLAQVILDIIPKLSNKQSTEIYHYSNEGVLSWYDFAKEIMRMARIECTIDPIETKEYLTPAKRPHYSVLNKSKIKKEFRLDIPYWKDSLEECLKTLKARR